MKKRMRPFLSNKTFDQINLGDTASLTRRLTQKDIELFAILSGDVNPAHLDIEYAKNDMFHKLIAHGLWSATFFSTLLGTKLPGPGTIYLSQTLKFCRPVGIDDKITATITVIKKYIKKPIIQFDCTGVNQKGKTVIMGIAKVLAPTEKIKRQQVELPQIFIGEKNEANYKDYFI